MTDAEHLPNAPIVEALLDIRFAASEPIEQPQLLHFGDVIRDLYPTRHEKSHWKGQVELMADGPSVTAAAVAPAGYQFTSGDGRQVIQARPDGFSLSRLRPYESWEQLRDEARRLWEVFEPLARPTRVERIALRYINRLELPLPFSDFKEYLLTVPEVAPSLPQGLASFFFRVVIPDERGETMVIVTETIEPGDSNRTALPLILDIDAFRQGVFPQSGEDLWSLFANLRETKNRFFFGSITDKAKELCK